jgi:hypothetical protein
VQQLHDEVGFARGRATGHSGADARGNRRIQKIDIEADVQDAVLRPYPVDHPADQHADAEFVDRTHIRNRDVAITDEVLFRRIHRPDPEQVQSIGADGDAGLLAEQTIKPGFAAQKGCRHAVHVAGESRFRRVVVGVGIEPEQEERSAPVLPVSRHAVHRSHRKAVIASHEDRNGTGTSEQPGALAERSNPGLDLVVIPGICGRLAVRRKPAVNPEIAMVFDVELQLLEHAGDARRSQRGRTHQRAGLGGADLDGNAEQSYPRLPR